MTESAWSLWDAHYDRLTVERPGLAGEVVARGPAQVRRLAMIYALIDSKGIVSVDHLQAALALWKYACESALHIFGDGVGDPLADKLLTELRRAGQDGLAREQIRRIAGGREPGPQISAALELLRGLGLAQHTMEPSTGGRRTERWYASSAFAAADGQGPGHP
jgi:hypothetical protein